MIVRRVAVLSALAFFSWGYISLPEKFLDFAPYKYESANLFFAGVQGGVTQAGGFRELPSSVISLDCQPITVQEPRPDFEISAAFACTMVTTRGAHTGLSDVFVENGWPFPRLTTDIQAGHQFWKSPIFPWTQILLQLLLVAVLAASLRNDRFFRDSLPLPRTTSSILLLPAAAMVVRVALPMALLGAAAPVAGLCDPGRISTTAVVLMLVVAPVGEEFLFRGWGYALLARVFSPAATIAFTAVAFAIPHIVGTISTMPALALIQICGFLIGGLTLGVVRWRTGSLVACVIAHALANLVVLTISACK